MDKQWKYQAWITGFILPGLLSALNASHPIYFPTKASSYAEYKLIARAEPGFGFVISHYARLRLAIVGSEVQDEKAYSWLEMDYFPEGEEDALKVKVFLPEESLKKLPATLVEDLTQYLQPVQSIQKVIFQKGKEPPHQVETPFQKPIPWEMSLPFLKSFISWEVEEDPVSQALVLAPGKFEARYQTLHMRVNLPPAPHTFPNNFPFYETLVLQAWYSDQVPFALLKATSTVELHFQLPNEEKKRTIPIHTNLLLEKYGSDAKSLIEGEPKPVEVSAPSSSQA